MNKNNEFQIGDKVRCEGTHPYGFEMDSHAEQLEIGKVYTIYDTDYSKPSESTIALEEYPEEDYEYGVMLEELSEDDIWYHVCHFRPIRLTNEERMVQRKKELANG